MQVDVVDMEATLLLKYVKKRHKI